VPFKRFRPPRPNDLGDLPLFADCNPRDMRTIADLGTRIGVRAGQRLMAAGSRGSDVVLVLAGEAVCELGGKTVARFETGDFFGEVAVLDGQPRTATVRAVTDMDVLVLSPAEFHEMVGLSPQVAHRVLRAMANRLRQANSLALAAP